MKAPFIICTEGRDVRFCIGAGPDDVDAADALAINPLAPPEVLSSAAQERLERIKVLTAPFGYIPAEGVDPIPVSVLSDFLSTLGAIANEANQLLDQAAMLRHKAKRGEA
ncbi:hypothetical protein [Achromobacter xylosoxidans]|uniref:hypothetical protein n=1 Tax=Alcaligenes xylosoxydans xylosoxydans TaxID=85698 RepID=UPI0024497830|nr:hypothetical protein [Achromobacter xylosoxidans]MDH0519949.1 hypothetical protein [Achromobacter xylosoxidans]MDH0543845.1 hypothetical protein [Achromobacter xylosoxidans]